MCARLVETGEPPKNLFMPKKTTSGKAMQPENPTDNLPHFLPLESHHGVRKNKGHPPCNAVLGHRNIKNTLRYTQLVNFPNDDYAYEAATTVQEATAPIEAGFEYICEVDCTKLFRKRK